MKLRARNENRQASVEEENQGAVPLRLRVTLPSETYSEMRLAEFERNNEQALAGFKADKKRKKCDR